MIFFIISILFLSAFIFLVDKRIKQYVLLNKYKSVLELFDYFLSQAYDIIYNDQALAFTSEGHVKIPNDEFETMERNFINLTVQIMGTSNEKMFISFYGNRVMMIKNMILYFRNKIDSDQIAKMIQKRESSG